ncbi:uncharacterized protein LOC111325599 isoform X2 [Stylophora pistillata]|uniref:uncharacterized protein LOC111325599 isoform X2 n=1 Tax=Stylophora pistillata TaxID=50429 RepID=UPI000C0574AE|nr:uncharacterized protein LOC111325599 isoform X2 [Stylophora pistillata]
MHTTVVVDEFEYQIKCMRNNSCKSINVHPGNSNGKRISTRGLQRNKPLHFCKDIRDSGNSRGDGEYWIEPEKNEKPLKVYCDMATDGGGWLLVSNVVVDDPSSRHYSIESSYRET